MSFTGTQTCTVHNHCREGSADNAIRIIMTKKHKEEEEEVTVAAAKK